jgi:hypothetical protein
MEVMNGANRCEKLEADIVVLDAGGAGLVAAEIQVHFRETKNP